MRSPQSPPSGPPAPKAPEPEIADRALSCRSVLWGRAEPDAGPGAALEELEVRGCPVGPVLAVDCPEWAGVRCRAFAARGEASATVISRDEAAAMRALLALEGTLTERYRRRLHPLTVEPTAVPPPAYGGPPGAGTLPVGVTMRAAHPAAPMPPPVGLPADPERRRGVTRPDGPDGDAP